MATIQIHTLKSAGSDLFADSESYLHELSDAELTIEGGSICTVSTPVISIVTRTLTLTTW